jgi:integrase
MSSIRKKVHESGRVSWEARINIKGHPALSKSFSKKTDAKAWASDKEAKIRGGDKVNRMAEKTTVAEALTEYLQKHSRLETDKSGKERTMSTLPRSKMYAVQSVIHHLGEFSIEALTTQLVTDFLEKLQKVEIPQPANKKRSHPLYEGDKPRTYSPSAVRKLFYALKVALDWHAVTHNYSLGDKLNNVTPPPAWSKPRERRLEGNEEQRLLVACEGMYKDPEGWKCLIQLALETAMRSGELLGMRWDEVRVSQRFVIIPKEREKTRRGRQVPLSSKALAILEKMKAVRTTDTGRVFERLPSNTIVLGKGFKSITKRAGIEGLRFHDLRHEATSRFFERTSLQTMEISLITGHTEMKTLQRYANLRPQHLADKLDARLG